MPKFRYRAKDWSGKLVKGVVDLPDKETVVETVRTNGMVPLEVVRLEENSIMIMINKVVGRVTLKQIGTLTRQLSTMLKAGLPLSDALALLRDQTEGKGMMYQILSDCLNMVRGGQSLGTALDKYRKIFGTAYVASIKAGEEGGVMEKVLEKLAENLEAENDFRGKVKGAMIYPVIVVIGMIGVAVVMMIFVLPKLMTLYADFGTAKLPASTRYLMALSGIMVKWWWLSIPMMVGLAVFGASAKKMPKVKLFKDKMVLKIPIFGDLKQKTVLADTLRTMSMLLSAGISLVEALKIVADVAENEIYAESYRQISARVQRGFGVADSIMETGVYPMIVVQMVQTGEATGKLDEVLMRVSDYFTTEASQAVKALSAAIEPIMMIVLGIGVLFLVMAVIMPIYNLTSQF